MHNIGTVPTYKMQNIGIVPTSKMHNIGFQLARAVSVPVSQRSGGWLAMTLVATINIIFFLYIFVSVFMCRHRIQLSDYHQDPIKWINIYKIKSINPSAKADRKTRKGEISTEIMLSWLEFTSIRLNHSTPRKRTDAGCRQLIKSIFSIKLLLHFPTVQLFW